MIHSIKWIEISGCFFIIGMNMAFFLRDKRPMWRWFLFGKTLLTFYIALDLWMFDLAWTALLAMLGIIITSISLTKAWLSSYLLWEIEEKERARGNV